MPTDRNKHPVKEGDLVFIQAKVTKAFDAPRGMNLILEPTAQPPGEKGGASFGANSAACQLCEPSETPWPRTEVPGPTANENQG